MLPGEYDRGTTPAKAADLPTLPEPDKRGYFLAVEYARVTIARGNIRDSVNAGISQRELARRAGIRFETISRIETGKHMPSVATIEKVDRALKRTKKRL